MRFTELNIWQEAQRFTLEIYKICRTFPSTEKYGVISQIQKSSSSVAANIVEGYNRKSKKEFEQFLYLSKGSLSETEYFILLARDLNYISKEKSEILLNEYEVLLKMLNSFITYIRNS